MTQSIVFGAVPTGSGAQVRTDFNLCDVAEATNHEGGSAPSATYPFMLWRNDASGFLYRRNAANSVWEIIENYKATIDPGNNNDVSAGYIRGSRWINTSGNRIFFCLSNGSGAAVWSELGGGAAGGVSSVFGRSGAVSAQSGDYTASQITETGSAKILTATERTKLANINSYWTTRTSTDPAAIVKNVFLGAHDLRSLLVFYGIPFNINGINNSSYAAGQLARYDDVVLGYGLQDPAHPNYSTTTTIISTAKAINPNLVIYGNIDVGVSGGTSHNHTTTLLTTHINQWITAGANGIFCDNFGYDFGVSRTRQNTVINAIHGVSRPAMLFATTITDALSPAVNATYNSGGVATTANSGDAYLFRWAFNSDAISSPYFEALATVRSRGDAARAWRTSLGVRMYAVNTMVFTSTGQTTLENYRGISESLAHIWRLNGAGVALANWSGTGTDANKVAPYYPKVSPQPGGRLTAAYREPTNEFEASDLGITVHYESGNYTWSAPGPTATTSGGGGGTGGDSGLLPTSVQTTNGSPPNTERVMLKGSVTSVSLLSVASSRHAQFFQNRTTQTVVFTASDGIFGYSSGFGLPINEAVNFIRDPDNNQWTIA